VRASTILPRVAILFASACAPKPIVNPAPDGGGSDSGSPTTDELTGMWSNTSGLISRAYVFAETSDVRPELAGHSPTFLFYSYPEDTAPKLIQAGTYILETSQLVTEPLWDDYGGLTVGNRYQAPISELGANRFVLTTSDGALEYRRTTELP